MTRIYLGEFEELVLLSVAVQNGKAYGVSITHEIREQSGRNARLNQVHAALERLERKGMIISQMGEPTPERGGRRKRLFTINKYGIEALREVREIRSHFWNLIPKKVKLSEI